MIETKEKNGYSMFQGTPSFLGMEKSLEKESKIIIKIGIISLGK